MKEPLPENRAPVRHGISTSYHLARCFGMPHRINALLHKFRSVRCHAVQTQLRLKDVCNNVSNKIERLFLSVAARPYPSARTVLFSTTLASEPCIRYDTAAFGDRPMVGQRPLKP